MNSDEQEALKSRGRRRSRELAVNYEQTRVEIGPAIPVEVGTEPGRSPRSPRRAFSSAVMTPAESGRRPA